MTQLESYKDFIRSKGHRLTLSEILSTNHAAEYRKGDSLLRKEGWTVEVSINHKRPGQNMRVYKEPVTFQNGQGILL